MLRLSAVLLLIAASCSKETKSGLPPADNWGAQVASGGSAAAPPLGELAPMAGAASPHTGTRNPHEGMGIPPPPGSVAGAGDEGGGDLGSDPGGADPNHPMVAPQGPPKTLAKLPDGTLALGPFALKLPDGWTEVATTSSMRAGEFTFGAGGDADLTVYYFGPDGAGSVADNTSRWAGQFTAPEGTPKIMQVKVAGQDATTFALSGHYSAMAMPGTASVDKPAAEMLGMIIASPNGPYYWKLVGTKTVVEANAAKWKTLLDTLKLAAK